MVGTSQPAFAVETETRFQFAPSRDSISQIEDETGEIQTSTKRLQSGLQEQRQTINSFFSGLTEKAPAFIKNHFEQVESFRIAQYEKYSSTSKPIAVTSAEQKVDPATGEVITPIYNESIFTQILIWYFGGPYSFYGINSIVLFLVLQFILKRFF